MSYEETVKILPKAPQNIRNEFKTLMSELTDDEAKSIINAFNHKQFYYRSDPSDSASNTFMEMLDLIDGYGWVIDHRIGYINGSPCIRVVRN